jgi:2-keto-3-deoxy-L-rhamnonate aldolase RhmA
VVVGLSDLAASLGHAGQNRHPEVRRAAERIIAIVRDARRAVPGYNLHHWEEERDLVAQGVRWITIHAKTMLNRGARDLFTLLDQKQQH